MPPPVLKSVMKKDVILFVYVKEKAYLCHEILVYMFVLRNDKVLGNEHS